MTQSGSTITVLAAALWFAATAPSGASSGAQFQTTPTTFSGQATAVKGKIAGIPIVIVDTGPVDAGGGTLEAHLLCYPDGTNCTVGLPDTTNGALRVKVLNATVVAQGNHSRARASVAELDLNVAGHNVNTTFLEARADAECADGQAFVRAGSDVARLTVDGQPIVVNGDVNQRVPLPGGGVVIINEQVASVSGENGDVTVRALHVVIPGPLPGTDTDVVIAEAHADIRCGQRFCPADKDFVTGGGWLANPRRTFAVGGGIKNGSFWGHLLYVNHGTGLRAKGTGVTAYAITGATSRHIEGTCEVNSQPCTYQADVDDRGEPGREDTFRLTLSTGEVASGKLAGGNIQLHTCR